MEGSMDPWQLVPMMVFRSHTPSNNWKIKKTSYKNQNTQKKTQLCKLKFSYLDALFDPEVVAHGLPVLRTANVKQPLVYAALHGGVEHLEELGPD